MLASISFDRKVISRKLNFWQFIPQKGPGFDYLGARQNDPIIRNSIFFLMKFRRRGLVATEVIEAKKVLRPTCDFRIIQVPEFSFILMFWKQIFFVRIMKYQVEFRHLLSWRLLRPAYVNFLKTCGWNTNFHISWSH